MLGEGLRRFYPWFSGLAALNYFGHPSEFAAIIGCCDLKVLDDVHQLLPILQTYEVLRCRSQFDVLPQDHAILNGKADDFLLRLIADSKAFDIDISPNHESEALKLNQRFIARCVWTCSESLSELLKAGFNKWVALSRGSTAFQAAEKLTSPLNVAYQIGKMPVSPHFDRESRDLAVRHLILAWICGYIGLSSGGSLEFLLQASLNRSSPQARTARALLYCYSRLAYAIHNFKGVFIEDAFAEVAYMTLQYLCSKVGLSREELDDAIQSMTIDLDGDMCNLAEYDVVFKTLLEADNLDESQASPEPSDK